MADHDPRYVLLRRKYDNLKKVRAALDARLDDLDRKNAALTQQLRAQTYDNALLRMSTPDPGVMKSAAEQSRIQTEGLKSRIVDLKALHADAVREADALRDEAARLAGERSELERSNGDLCDAVEELSNRVAELASDGRMADLEKENAGLSNLVDELVDKVEVLKRENDEIVKERSAKDEAAEGMLAKFTKVVEALRVKNSALESEISSAKSGHLVMEESLRAHIDGLQRRVESLDEENARKGAVETRLRGQISDLESEKKARLVDEGKVKAMSAALGEKVEALEKELKDRIAGLEKFKGLVSVLEDEKDVRLVAEEELKRRIARLVKIVEELENEKGASLVVEEELKGRNAGLEKKVEELENEKKARLAFDEGIKSQMPLVLKKVETLLAENRRLKDEKEVIIGKNLGLEEEVQDLKRKKGDLESENDVKAGIEDSLRNENSRLMESMKTVLTKNSGLENEILARKGESKLLQDVVTDLNSKVSKFAKEVEALKAENDRLAKENSDAKATKDAIEVRLNNQISDLEKFSIQLNLTNMNLEDEMKLKNADLEAVVLENSGLSKAISLLRKEANVLTEEMNSLRSEISYTKDVKEACEASLKNEITKLQKDLEDMKLKNNSMISEKEASEALWKKLNTALSEELLSANAKAASDLESSRIRVVGLQKEVEVLNRKNSGLVSDNLNVKDTMDKMEAKLNSQISDLEKDAKNLKWRNACLLTRVENLKSAASGLQSAKSKLEVDYETANSLVSDLNDKVAQDQQVIEDMRARSLVKEAKCRKQIEECRLLEKFCQWAILRLKSTAEKLQGSADVINENDDFEEIFDVEDLSRKANAFNEELSVIENLFMSNDEKPVAEKETMFGDWCVM